MAEQRPVPPTEQVTGEHPGTTDPRAERAEPAPGGRTSGSAADAPTRPELPDPDPVPDPAEPPD